ncbi:putative transcription factor C2H2 family [Helianthus anomalus]
MNFDLNLGYFDHPSSNDQPQNISIDELLSGSIREVGSNHPTVNHRLPPVHRHIPVPTVAVNPPLGVAASGAAADNDEKVQEAIKTDENGDEGSFFDCNICLDLASEPVVTCCGHLFCWPCIYRWLFLHSHAKQCPICKGEVTMKTITPIYSRSNVPHVTKVIDPNSSYKIPSRPPAHRIESWRHSFQRETLNLPIIEMVRRLDNNRFHLSRDPLSSNPQEILSTHLLNRIFTSRGMRRGRDSVPATSPEVTVDLPNDYIPNLTSGESFVDSYFRDHPEEINQDEFPLMDRHSMSSVAGIIQSEVTTTSMGSRRRREPATSTVLDVDRGNSRPRRRRLL